jgi:hypothetical protein
LGGAQTSPWQALGAWVVGFYPLRFRIGVI